MNKEYKIVFVAEPNDGGSTSNGNDNSGNNQVGGKLTVTMKNGLKRYVRIKDPEDATILPELMKEANNGSRIAAHKLARIISNYDSLAAGSIFLGHGFTGEGWESIGDGFDDHSVYDKAIDAYKKSAEARHYCGKCKLGRYYAEGKGCKKNMILAKKWLKEAAEECSDAEKYLDQYGLR